MKTGTKSILIAGILVSGFSVSAIAEKMDLVTHNMLIQKLERVLDQLTDGDLSKSTISLRLADLKAEKARILDMEDAAVGSEKNRSASKASRHSAITLYKENLKTASQQKQGEVFLQMAHLHEMLGEDAKAEALYEGVIQKRKNYSEDTVGRSLTARGDLAFRKGQYKKALQLFKDAVSMKGTPRKGYLHFRIAWSEFHLGNQIPARQTMVQLLSSPELLKRKSDGGIDTALQEEASRDLATFLARSGIQAKDLKLLSDLSPDNVRVANLTTLATELDRTGRKKESLLVWNLLGSGAKAGTEKLEGQIKIAQIQYDLGKKAATVVEINKAITMWNDDGCDEVENCHVLRQQLRKILTDWGKAEEREPSPQLIQAYTTYLQTFPDLEINYWAGNAARKLQQYTLAGQFYRIAADLAADAVNDSSKSSVTRISQIFEGALLSEIEVAELSGNVDLRENAYLHYMKLNGNGSQALKVRYQMAHVLSERKQYADAADAFRKIASSRELQDASLQEKSADLALDNLVLAKDDKNLEQWATEFAKLFPLRRGDFQRIARQSVLNQAAQAFNDPDAHDKLDSQLEKLLRLDLKVAPVNEQTNVLKHIILIAFQLKKVEEVDLASARLLKIPGLSPKESDEALERRAWAAELRLDFASALYFHEKIKTSKLSDDERTMKLAILAELAGKNPTPYYQRYLRIGKLQSQKQWSAYQLIVRSKNKSSALRQYAGVIRANSTLFAKASLMAYQQNSDLTIARQALAVPGVNSTPEGRALNQILFLEKLSPLENEVSRHRLNASSQKSLKSSLTHRLQLISKVELHANKAIEMADWTLQLKTLALTTNAQLTLAREIQNLPLPQGLRKSERAQYKHLLAQQASPYIEKAKEIQLQINRLWQADENLEALRDRISQGSSDLAKAATQELKIVTAIAKKTGHMSAISNMKTKSGRNLDGAQLAQAREQVQKNPFSLSSIEKLRNMERTRGRESMVAYLDGRIHELQERGRN